MEYENCSNYLFWSKFSLAVCGLYDRNLGICSQLLLHRLLVFLSLSFMDSCLWIPEGVSSFLCAFAFSVSLPWLSWKEISQFSHVRGSIWPRLCFSILEPLSRWGWAICTGLSRLHSSCRATADWGMWFCELCRACGTLSPPHWHPACWQIQHLLNVAVIVYLFITSWAACCAPTLMQGFPSRSVKES